MKRKAQQNRFMKILTSPLRALSKARDMYVNSMNQYADRTPYGGAGAWGLPAANPLARSFSVNSIRSRNRMSYEEADDFRGLIRATSAKNYGDLKGCLAVVDQAEKRRQLMGGNTKAAFGGSRSSSVGMTKIDEDRAWDEDEEEGSKEKGKKAKVGGGGVPPSLYPRSKSYAVSSLSANS